MEMAVSATLPAFDEVLALIRLPKPPLACRVVEMRDGDELRSARVIFDGIAGWLIETEDGRELRHADDFVLFDDAGVLRRIGPHLDSHSNGWVKTPIEGKRMSLDQATGRVIGLERIDGRESVLAEFHGLRSGEDATFQLSVDLATGVIVRIVRTDLGLILRLEDLRIGTIEEAP